MNERPLWTWLGPLGGVVAVVAPMGGWLALGSSPTGGGASVFLGLGGVAVVACFGGAVVGLLALIKSKEIPSAKGVGIAAIALSLFAVLTWCLEWGLLFTTLATHDIRF